MAIRQKHYLHRDVKFKSKRVAKRNQRKKKVEKKTVGFPAKATKVILSLYVVKTKSSGMRNVLFLQTTNPANHVTQDDKKKSLSYKIYDYIRVELTYPIKE